MHEGRAEHKPGPPFQREPSGYYLMIFVTVPAPTVRPPSRMANR